MVILFKFLLHVPVFQLNMNVEFNSLLENGYSTLVPFAYSCFPAQYRTPSRSGDYDGPYNSGHTAKSTIPSGVMGLSR